VAETEGTRHAVGPTRIIFSDSLLL